MKAPLEDLTPSIVAEAQSINRHINGPGGFGGLNKWTNFCHLHREIILEAMEAASKVRSELREMVEKRE